MIVSVVTGVETVAAVLGPRHNGFRKKSLGKTFQFSFIKLLVEFNSTDLHPPNTALHIPSHCRDLCPHPKLRQHAKQPGYTPTYKHLLATLRAIGPADGVGVRRVRGLAVAAIAAASKSIRQERPFTKDSILEGLHQHLLLLELEDPGDQIRAIEGRLIPDELPLNLRPVRIRRLGDEEVQFPEVAGHGHGVHEGGVQGPLAAGLEDGRTTRFPSMLRQN